MSLIHKHLPAALGGNRVAARALHIGASFAGAGAGNALLGAGQALAHQLGAHFPSLSPGACCALVLADVVAYNAVDATRLTVTPLCTHADGLDRVALLSNHLSLAPVTWSREAKRDAVVGALVDLRTLCGLPGSLHEAGLSTADFAAALPGMALGAFKDPILACVPLLNGGELSRTPFATLACAPTLVCRTNPRAPLISELEALLLLCK